MLNKGVLEEYQTILKHVNLRGKLDMMFSKIFEQPKHSQDQRRSHSTQFKIDTLLFLKININNICIKYFKRIHKFLIGLKKYKI